MIINRMTRMSIKIYKKSLQIIQYADNLFCVHVALEILNEYVQRTLVIQYVPNHNFFPHCVHSFH